MNTTALSYARMYPSLRRRIRSFGDTYATQAPNVTERKFDLPVKTPVADKNEALDMAIRYGFDLVDGQIPGFDARSLL